MDYKICIKCNISKDIDKFTKDNNYKDGYRKVCKHCRNTLDRKKKKPRNLIGIDKCLECEYKHLENHIFEVGSQSVLCKKYSNFVGFTTVNKFNNINLKCIKEEENKCLTKI